MFCSDFVYNTEVIYGPNLGTERLEADVLHDKVDMDAETYVIYGKSEITERSQRGARFKSRPGNVIYGVDILIAETIAVLNRKGYTTDACCQGHLTFMNDVIYEVDSNNSDNLKNLLRRVKAGESEIVQVKGNIYYVVSNAINCWIRTNKARLLPNIPENSSLQKLERDDDTFMLRTIVPSYYVVDGKPKKKSDEVVALELIKMHENLKKWAYSLPSLVKENTDFKSPAKV